MTIRIASNTGDLSAVTSGFILLVKTLEQAARRENPKAEDKKALLRHVVIIDLHQILSRLRSRHARRTQKTAGKQPLTVHLNQAVYDKGVKARSGFTKSIQPPLNLMKTPDTCLSSKNMSP
ncbi:hypothetical protein BGZ57DRAFT_936022 [Hyaloscypha finlandica]|nr:hypothetical protein BGZ57DRAFT_936022 [Hyaloscypha finlandica]